MNPAEFVLIGNKYRHWSKDKMEEHDKRHLCIFLSYKRLPLFGNKLILCILMVTCLKSVSAQISEGKCTFFLHSFLNTRKRAVCAP